MWTRFGVSVNQWEAIFKGCPGQEEMWRTWVLFIFSSLSSYKDHSATALSSLGTRICRLVKELECLFSSQEASVGPLGERAL